MGQMKAANYQNQTKMFKFYVFFVVLPLIIISASSIPQICNKLLVSRYYNYANVANFTLSANLEIFKNSNSSSTISVSNVLIEGYLIYGVPDSACVDIDSTPPSPDSETCSKSLSQPFIFTTQKPSFNLNIHFPLSGKYFNLYFGFADDGTFTYIDGTFFTSKNSSYHFIENDDNNSSSIFTQTCTSFIPAPTPTPPTSNSSKCKTFKSQITILNTDDNYSIFATSSMNWTFTENGIKAVGNSSIPMNYEFTYYINNGYGCKSDFCSLPIKKGDKKLVIFGVVEEQMGWERYYFPIPFVGRILLRGNETLMAEGIPFSPLNNCLYFNFPFSATQVSTNQLCCIEFENYY